MWKWTPSRILVPVDFSDASGRAVAVASALSARTGASLHVLHAEVIEVPAYFTREQLAALDRERRLARQRADEFLRDFARRHGSGTFTSEVVEGPPTAVITGAAANADLVVMGTHGRRGPARWWLGSVAERVCHESPTPVLVVRAQPPHTDQAADAIFGHPMLVSTDSASDAPARQLAQALAEAFGGQVAPAAATCQADLARDRQATLIVVPSAERHGALVPRPAEHWLRHCPLPMLFVPERVSNPPGRESLELESPTLTRGESA